MKNSVHSLRNEKRSITYHQICFGGVLFKFSSSILALKRALLRKKVKVLLHYFPNIKGPFNAPDRLDTNKKIIYLAMEMVCENSMSNLQNCISTSMNHHIYG